MSYNEDVPAEDVYMQMKDSQRKKIWSKDDGYYPIQGN